MEKIIIFLTCLFLTTSINADAQKTATNAITTVGNSVSKQIFQGMINNCKDIESTHCDAIRKSANYQLDQLNKTPEQRHAERVQQAKEQREAKIRQAAYKKGQKDAAQKLEKWESTQCKFWRMQTPSKRQKERMQQECYL